jgi:hypothetical protein
MPKIRDPRRPEVMLWLSTLEGEARLTMLLALKYAFPYLEAVKEWRDLTERVSDELKLTPRAARGPEHGAAARLLAALLAHARSSGLTALYLGTTEEFRAAHRF